VTTRAEWVKLRTVRSTTMALLALAGVSLLFSALACWESHTEGRSPGSPGDNDIVLDSLAGIWFGQIAVAVLGVLAIASEYSSGLIRTTLAAVPRRRTVLAAKTAVVAVVVAVVGLAATVACFFVGQEILRGNGFTYENGYPAESLADGSTLRAVVGTAIYLTLLAVFALGVGAVLRHTAGAITAVLALLLGPVIAISFLPESVADIVERSALLAAGLSIQQTVESPDNLPLGPWEGLGVVAAYAAVALLAAMWLITRRDA
jgi:ABC-type transport system involved in multi-copper enzyme maturation permease subunit